MAVLIKSSASLIHYQVKSLLDRKLYQNKMLTINYGVHNVAQATKQTLIMMREV